MAGGGSTLSVPTLLFLGLDAATANGTNRVALLIECVAGVRGFHDQQQSAFADSLRLSLLTLPGALIGAWFAVRIDGEWFRIILSLVMVGVVLSLIFPLKQPDSNVPLTTQRRWLSNLGMVGIGFYGGFIQIGVGFLLIALLFHGFRETLVRANMHKAFIVMIYTIPALLVFVWNDNVDWGFGLALGAGNAVGAYVGANLSVKKGEAIVRKVMFVAIIVIVLKLLDFF